MFSTAKNTTAQCKLQFCKKLELFKLIIAFNVTTRNARGKLLFPQQQKCAYVSGHFAFDELAQQLTFAEQHLRTNRIQIVE